MNELPPEDGTQRPRLPVTMMNAVDPNYSRIRSEMAERFRSRVAERRRAIMAASAATKPRPIAVGGNGGDG
jgi:hypothetical protein